MTIIRKRIRHLYIRVDPDAGGITVSAPFHLTDAQIWDAVRSREGWIQRRVERVRSRTIPTIDERSTRLFGESIPIAIHESSGLRAIVLTDGVLVLNVRSSVAVEDRLELLDAWHRAHLAKRIPGIVARWEPVLGVSVAEWRIRKMRTRWGTCNPRARRIWLNLALGRFPIECLEYVVVHEMVHLLERGHNWRFYSLMDQYLPDWRAARAMLRNSPPGR